MRTGGVVGESRRGVVVSSTVFVLGVLVDNVVFDVYVQLSSQITKC